MKLAFTSLFTILSSYLNNMAIFCLLKNCIFDNSNLTRGHISLLEDYSHHDYDIEALYVRLEIWHYIDNYLKKMIIKNNLIDEKKFNK